MSQILAKSKKNLETATLLVDNSIMIPSAHSAYYAIFLMLKYLLNKNNIMSYAEQDKKTKESNSHNIIQSSAFDLLSDLEKADSAQYMVWLMKVKKMRKNADYKNLNIEDCDIKQNLQYASDFINGITKHYGI